MTEDLPRQLLAGRNLVFTLDCGPYVKLDTDQFKSFVELAAEFGGTHISVGQLPYRYGWFLPDNTDPYAAWCNQAPGMLRVFPPDEIQAWVPQDDALEMQASIEEKMAIARPYGLKGIIGNGLEPLWLPEGVYRAHPSWRGPQVELARIAKRPYFSPSIDEPEVLELYRRAMQTCAERFPDIDQFQFMSNDSGAGISWCPNLYPGMNGPSQWRTRDPGQRIAEWMKAMQDGAREGGCDARIMVHSSGLSPGIVGAALARLGPGLFLNWQNSHEGEGWGGGGASLYSMLWSASYPAVGLGDPIGFVRGLQAIYTGNAPSDDGRAEIRIDPHHLEVAKMSLDAFFKDPGGGSLKRSRMLVDVATSYTGDTQQADPLIDVWQGLTTATQTISQIRQKGFGLVLPWCGVSMRWLTRPLVPEPEKLTDEETAHYRDHLFSVGLDDQDVWFNYVLGKGVFRGESVMWMSRWCLQEVVTQLSGLAARIRKMAADTTSPEGASRLRLQAARVGVYASAAATARNTIMYQYALDIAGQPQYGPNQMDYDDNILYDQRVLTFRKIAREEVDNVTALIALLESTEGVAMAHAASDDEEGVFMLGPNLIADLQRKVDIMLDHWQDYEDLYPSTKVWDFEPEPLGNIFPPGASGAAE